MSNEKKIESKKRTYKGKPTGDQTETTNYSFENQQVILQNIIDNYDDSIFSIDRNYCYTSFNKLHASRMKALYGVNIQIGKNLLDSVDDEVYREKFKKSFDLVFSTGKAHSEELYLTKKILFQQHLNVTYKPLNSPNGEISGVIVVFRDISGQKRLEEKHNQTEIEYKTLFLAGPDAFYVATLHSGKIIEVNPGFETLFGYTREEVIGKTSKELTLWSDYTARKQMISDIERNGQTNLEVVIQRKDKELRNCTVSVKSFLLKDQQYVIGVAHDITERKKAEKILQQSEGKLRLLFRSIQDGIVVADLEGNIIDINDAVIQMRGSKTKDELIGHSAFEFISPKDHAKTIKSLETLKTDGQEQQAKDEIILVRADGSEYVAEVSASLVKDASGNLTGYVAIFRDITERKKAEDAVKQRNKELVTLNKVAQSLNRPMKSQNVLCFALNCTLQATNSVLGCIHIVDSDTGKLILATEKCTSGKLSKDISGRLLSEILATEAKDTGRVIIKNRAVNDNAAKNGVLVDEWGQIQSFVSIPIKSKGNVLAVMSLAHNYDTNISPADIRMLETIGHQIGVAIENAQLLDKLGNLSATDELTGMYNRRHFYKLLDIEMARVQRYGRSLSLVMIDLDGFKKYNDKFGHVNGDSILKAFAKIMEAALRKSDAAFRLGGDEFAILLVAADTKESQTIIDRLRSKWITKFKELPISMDSQIGFSAGIAHFPEDAATSDGLIFLADTALFFSKRQGRDRTTLVSDLGTVSADAQFDVPLEQIYALAATVDSRDPYTYGHSKRIAKLCELIGTVMGLSQKELADLRAASLLHDIGKVGVPDSILSKRGILVEKEFAIIRQHPIEGARIVGFIKALADLVPLILYHHEWFNGTGYPKGLEGQDIPLGAKIIAVADAYDAMTTTRPYKSMISHESALQELRRCSGTQFDPSVVEAFCKAISDDFVVNKQRSARLVVAA